MALHHAVQHSFVGAHIHENFCRLYVLSPKGLPHPCSILAPHCQQPLIPAPGQARIQALFVPDWSEVMSNLSPRFYPAFLRLCVTLSRKAPPSGALFIISEVSEVPQTSLAHCPQIQKKICLLPANKIKVLEWDRLLWETLVS